VHPMFECAIEEGERVRVTWVSAASPRVQGVVLSLRIPGRKGRKGDGGLLRIEGVDAPEMSLWMDTAPPVVDAECVKRKQDAELWVTNQWRYPDGTEDELINNYGIKIEALGPRSVRLHCSDGYGDAPSFDDLVVQIDVL
jgi:hypothetical protein